MLRTALLFVDVLGGYAEGLAGGVKLMAPVVSTAVPSPQSMVAV